LAGCNAFRQYLYLVKSNTDMRILVLVLCSIFFSNINAQVKSTIDMTPAEYQNLMETILKARQKRFLIHQHNMLMQQNQMAQSNIDSSESVVESKVMEMEERFEMKEKNRSKEIERSNVQNSDAKYEQLDREIYDLKRELGVLETKLIESEKDNYRNIGNIERKLDYNNDQATNGSFDDDDLQRLIRNQETMSSELATMQREFDQSPQNVDTRMRDLNREVKEMKAAQTLWFAAQGQSNDGDDTKMSAESQKAMLDWAAKMASLETEIEALKNKDDYDRLNKEVDRLKNVKPITVPKTDFSRVNSKMAAMQKEIDQLRLELARKESVSQQTVTTSKVTMDINTFITKHRQQNIYFGNGSSQLTEAEKSKIQEVAGWLKKYDSLDIIIKGFASNVGSKSTNQALSEGRAIAVRDYIRSIGITADRMSLEPLGVDSSMSDPASARRAEIHLYISQN